MKPDEPNASDDGDAYEIARQADVELAILLGIEKTLRIALQWMTRGRGNSRKLSTLRFQMWSFERHLTRMQALADHGGYMHLVTDAAPHLASDVESLGRERARLHADLDRLIICMDHVSQDDADGFAQICVELTGILDRLRAQGENERELVRQAIAHDEGGPA